MKTSLLAIAALIALALAPSQASAATCADYSTQSEAQRAADTRDGDGLYFNPRIRQSRVSSGV